MKKAIKLCLILLLPFLLTGCYNYRELNNLGLTVAVGISKSDDKFLLTAEVLNTEKTSSDEENDTSYAIFKTSGQTIQEAFRDVVNVYSKRLYINHMQILVIDEELAKDSLNDIIDFFFRDPESRKQFLVLITSDNIEDILSSKTLLNNINATDIKEKIQTNYKYLGTTEEKAFGVLISDYINPYKDITIPIIKLNDDEGLELSDTAIFKNNKLVGHINAQDTLFLNMLNNDIDNTIFTMDNGDKKISIEIDSNKTNFKIDNNNININVKLSGSISEINYDVDLTNPSIINKIENEYNTKLSQDIYNSIHSVINTYDSDIYGFRDKIYKENPQYIKNNNINLSDLNIKVDVKLNLSSKGNGVDNINEKN